MNEEMDGTLDRFAAEIARPLRARVHITEGFQGRTMAALRRQRIEPSPAMFGTSFIRVSPLGAFALAAAILIVALSSVALGRNSVMQGIAVAPAAPALAAAPPDTIHVVRFQLAAPGAHTVALVGDFNDWSRDAIVLKPADKRGVWTASVPLSPGRHEYAFVVDGKKWVADPYAVTHRDEFDVVSSVIRVGDSGA